MASSRACWVPRRRQKRLAKPATRTERGFHQNYLTAAALLTDGRRPMTKRDHPFGTLHDLLQTASALAEEMAAEPWVGRLLRVFGRFPPADREVIVGVLAREA